MVAEELSDHFLRWHGRRIDTRMCKFDTPRLSLYSLRYGAEVSIVPDCYDGFSLVHFSLSGCIEVEADHDRQQVPQGRALVSTPRRSINLRWSEGSEQIILRLPHSLLQETAAGLGKSAAFSAALQKPGLVLDAGSSRLWQAQLKAFVALENSTRRNAAFDPWLSHMEQGMAMFLLLQDDRPAGHKPVPAGDMADDRRQRRLDRLHEFALTHLDQPVTLADLANAAALSQRQLNAFCHAELGQSPLSWLRGLRLDAIRAALVADPQTNLADLAMLHGFFHLGRFSASYCNRFGELPSQTRRNAKGG